MAKISKKFDKIFIFSSEDQVQSSRSWLKVDESGGSSITLGVSKDLERRSAKLDDSLISGNRPLSKIVQFESRPLNSRRIFQFKCRSFSSIWTVNFGPSTLDLTLFKNTFSFFITTVPIINGGINA